MNCDFDGATLVDQWSSLQMQLDAHRPDRLAARCDVETTTPVVLLAGFLGAGKTTLLVRLLAEPPDGVAIRGIVNDVGSLPFDPTMVAAASGLEIELSNGCACCQNTGDLSRTLDSAADADLVVLEASGVADPLALTQVVEARPALHLERIVTLIDGRDFEARLGDPQLGALLRRQLEAAHTIVITRADESGAADIERLATLASRIAPGRPVITSTLDDPAVDTLVGDTLSGARLPPETPAWNRLLPTVTLAQTDGRTSHEVDRVLASRPVEIMRCKGILEIDGSPHLVQSTPTTYSIEPARAPNHSGAQLTVIGTDLGVATSFAAALGCFASTADDDEPGRPSTIVL